MGQNIAARESYDRERAQSCCQKAGVWQRVASMASGMDTVLYKDLSEKGVEVSGGEAQKLAIARALYRDSAFLILDEPTAALDPLSEYEIYARLSEIVEDKTAVYISHRLSSCRFCDEILVFIRGVWCSREAMRGCLHKRTASTANCGMHRRSIMWRSIEYTLVLHIIMLLVGAKPCPGRAFRCARSIQRIRRQAWGHAWCIS